MQGSAISPASYVVNAADLTTVTAGNLMFKYADDTYIIIAAANANSRSAELDHVDRWAQKNNLSLNRAKSAEIIFTNCNRKPTEGLPPQIPDIRHVTSIKMLGITMTNHLSAGEHVRDVIGKCRRHCRRHHGMSDDSLRHVYKAVVLSKLLCPSPAWWGFTLLARPISNVSKHLYDVLFSSACTPPTIPRRLNWLLTWMTTSSRRHYTILTMFSRNFSQTKLIIHTISDVVVTLCH